MATKSKQVRLMMEIYQRTGCIQTAAAKADVHRTTAAKYINNGGVIPPSPPRDYRTRRDPFEAVWQKVTAKLKVADSLRPKDLFDWVCREHPGKFQAGQLRTFQRRVSQWRGLHGPNKEVFFPQDHKPGQRMSLDFTHAKELGITIADEPFDHLLGHCALTYSNWSWATIVASESYIAVQNSFQEAAFRLGKLPVELWTDNSTGATHRIPESGAGKNVGSEEDGAGSGRAFNQRYEEMTAHFGVKPCTINVGQSHENGDIESLNGHLKACIEQELLLRGSRDFVSVEAYRDFLHVLLNRRNALRTERLNEELAVMRPVTVEPIPEYTLETAPVSKNSIVQVARNAYSVPSRLIGKRVDCRVYDRHIEIYYSNTLQVSTARLLGERKHRIDYRHVIHSLLCKPGAFANYCYRDDLFPTLNFRRSYDELLERHSPRSAATHYLRILSRAADAQEEEVNQALATLLAAGTVPSWSAVESQLPARRIALPEMAPVQVDIDAYNRLLEAS